MNFVVSTFEYNRCLSSLSVTALVQPKKTKRKEALLKKKKKKKLTNFLRKVCEKIFSKPKVSQIGKVTDTSGKGGQLIISQNQFLREKKTTFLKINSCLQITANNKI